MLPPFSKSSSTSTLAHDVRPIAMGECLVKLAAHYALHLVRPQLSSLLSPIQLGLSPGSTEHALLLTQSALELSPSPDTVVLKVDFSNAFNTLSRHSILTQLFARSSLKPLWRLCHWAYSSPSQLLLSDGSNLVVHSPLGGRRPPRGRSSLLFCFRNPPSLSLLHQLCFLSFCLFYYR